MTYKIKHSKKLPKGYWEERELREFRKKNKKKLPFTEVTREGSRTALKVPSRVHVKGRMVQYKEGLAQVKKVSRKGIWIEVWNKPTDKSIASPSGKIIFVPEKRVEHEIYPVGSKVPCFFMSAPMSLGD